MSRTWKDRPLWVRSQDSEHEGQKLEVHHCGCHPLRNSKECDIDMSVSSAKEFMRKSCWRTPVNSRDWVSEKPNWWVRDTATKPDRSRLRRNRHAAVKAARSVEVPGMADEMWDVDFGHGKSRVPYFH